METSSAPTSDPSGDLLVAAPARWDEACFSVPAVRALAASGLRVSVLCLDAQKDFWAAETSVMCVPFRGRPRLRTLPGSWSAFLCWEDSDALAAAARSGIPRRTGPAAIKACKHLTHPVTPAERPGDHRVRWYLETVAPMGIPTDRPEFFQPAAGFPPPEDRTLILAPDSDFGAAYEWPAARWERLAAALAEEPWKITVAGLPGGRDLGKKLAGFLGARARFFEAFPLGGTLPVLAAHARIIAADSSLPHLAAHAGVTCATLFGPGDPSWKRPLGKRHSVLRRHVECGPCLLAKCPLDLRCQAELTEAAVLAALSAG